MPKGKPSWMREVQWNDLKKAGYTSVSNAAKSLGMPSTTLSYRLNNLALSFAAASKPVIKQKAGCVRRAGSLTPEQEADLGGRTILALAKEVGIADSTLLRRLWSGMSLAEALGKPSRSKKNELSGAHQRELSACGYSSLREAANACNIPYGLVRDRWLRLEWGLIRALKTPPPHC